MNRFSELRILMPNLFPSVIVDGRTSFFKKLCLILKGGILYAFLVILEVSDYKSIEDVYPSKFCKTSKVRYVNAEVEGTPDLAFPKKCLLIYL